MPPYVIQTSGPRGASSPLAWLCHHIIELDCPHCAHPPRDTCRIGFPYG